MAETNYKVIDFYDGEGDVTEAFADVIARRITGRGKIIPFPKINPQNEGIL